MARNQFLDSEQVLSAASALALLVRDKQKPVVFDMDIYAAFVVGIPTTVTKEDLLDRMTTDEIMDLALQEKKRHADSSHFAEALADAFTRTEVQDLLPCYLAELGHTDKFAVLGESWIWVVAPEPTADNAFVLDL